MDFTITVPDAMAADLVAALRRALGSEVEGKTNLEVVELVVRNTIYPIYRGYRQYLDTAAVAEAQRVARAAAEAAVVQADRERERVEREATVRAAADVQGVTVT